ncbi:TRM11 family SAM-dependent methyltransferase [Streptomyces sp. NPDC007264]|uniref:TRM11 family SAM-dependent methyltransferase n=1 Tax=Streptomyces sp. NPDC007264 TaxID=3364777 RepID=UPI0036DEC196
MRYFIQYPAGTTDLVADALSHFVDDFSVHYSDDSAMIFDSTSSAEQVAQIPFAKNAFVVLATTPRKGIDQSARQFSGMLGREHFPALPGRTPGFRVMAHVDGELTSLDPAARRDLERAVSASTGRRVEPRGKCQEYWLIGRLDLRELMFCARLPKPARAKKGRGAVSHELSSMLVLASRPGDRDVYLDPFAGSGSFVLARLDMPAHRIIYSDTDLKSHRDDFPAELTGDQRVRLLSEDALTLPSLADGEVDVIVTDPPWGEYEELPLPYAEFTRAVSESFARVLDAETGRFVLLCARRGAPDYRTSLEAAGLAVEATHEILVNGHPATVFVGGRPSDGRTEREGEREGEGERRRDDEGRAASRQGPLLVGMSTYRRTMRRFSQ